MRRRGSGTGATLLSISPFSKPRRARDRASLFLHAHAAESARGESPRRPESAVSDGENTHSKARAGGM